MAYNDNEKRTLFKDEGIANDHQQEQVLKGIQPKNQFAYKLFRYTRILAIITLILTAIMFGITFINNEFLLKITTYPLYRKAVLYMGIIGFGFLFIMFLIKLIFLRKCPFDDWVFEVAQRRLGTQVIFYTSKCIYIQYDIAAAKEVDKRDFVTEMSDKSANYSYFYVNTFVDQQVIQVECTKRQPIPTRASFSPDDDLFWNIIPLGLTINGVTQSVSPIGWYLNDQKKNDQLVETVPSTSILICGGPLALDTVIPTTTGYKTMESIKIGDKVFDINNKPVKVLNKSEIFVDKQCYQLKLVDNTKNNKIYIKASFDHRFPIIDNNTYKDIQVKDIIIGSKIKGNFYNYTVEEIKPIGIIDTQCILIDSNEHEFIIAEKQDNKWSGGIMYNLPGVYTRNTGCFGKDEVVIIPNTLVMNIDELN